MMQNEGNITKREYNGRQSMAPWPYCQAEFSKASQDAKQYEMFYPDIFYKVQPYVLEACDRIESYGYTMPTKEMLDQVSEGICSNVYSRYPDIDHYSKYAEASANHEAAADVYYRRRSNIFQDLVDILLLNELFGRRRRYY